VKITEICNAYGSLGLGLGLRIAVKNSSLT
jgi:hypothetical protein